MSSPQQPPPDPQAAQAGLAVVIGLAIAQLWPSLDLFHLRESLPAFKAAVVQEVQRHAQASATLAVRQYKQQRVLAGVGSGFTPRPADPPPIEQVAQAVDWAVQPLWDSAIPVASIPDAPAETVQAASTAIADAKARVAASAEKLVLDAGRDTIIANVQQDRKAKAWARIAEPGACSFCAMLATRGAVYHVQRGEFKAHDNCRCHVEPVFGVYEPPARVREWQALYQKVVVDQNRSGQDARTAFRQAIEGREVTGGGTTRGGTGKPRNPAKAPLKTRASATEAERADMMRAELNALQDRLPSLNEQQRAWMTKRIDTLRKQLGI